MVNNSWFARGVVGGGLLVLWFGMSPLRAATRSWDGSANGYWTNAANWNINTVPVNGDQLVFPSGPARLLTTNTLGGASNFHSVLLSGSNYVLLSLPSLSVTNGVTNSTAALNSSNTIRGHITARANQTWLVANRNTLILSSNLAIPAVTITSIVAGTLQLDGVVSGSGRIVKDGNGRLEVNGISSVDIDATDGTLEANGTLSGDLTVLAGAFLEGGGTVPAFNCSGSVRPGGFSSVGRLTVASAGTVFNAGSTLQVDLLGTTPGTGYDQIVVPDAITLTGATLSVFMNATLPIGTKFFIITNTLAGAFTTTFAGLPEGALLTNGPTVLRVSYADGNSNDVSLTVQAVNSVWDGGGTTNLWTTAANWQFNQAPVPNATLIFPPGPTNVFMFNDFTAGTVFRELLFTSNGYELNGNDLALQSGVRLDGVSNASTILSVNVRFSTNASIRAEAAPTQPTIALNSGVTLDNSLQVEGCTAAFNQSVSGLGPLTVTNGFMTLNEPNSYAGLTRVLSNGAVSLASLGTLGAIGAVDRTEVENGGRLILNDTNAIAETLTLRGALEFAVSSNTAVWSGPITVSLPGAPEWRIAASSTGVISGFVAGSANVAVTGGGTLFVNGQTNTASGSLRVDRTKLVMNGRHVGSVILTNGTLMGTGTVNSVSSFAAVTNVVRPGFDGPGILTCTNFNNTTSTGLTCHFDIDGMLAGFGHGQLRYAGTNLLNRCCSKELWRMATTATNGAARLRSAGPMWK